MSGNRSYGSLWGLSYWEPSFFCFYWLLLLKGRRKERHRGVAELPESAKDSRKKDIGRCRGKEGEKEAGEIPETDMNDNYTNCGILQEKSVKKLKIQETLDSSRVSLL